MAVSTPWLGVHNFSSLDFQCVGNKLRIIFPSDSLVDNGDGTYTHTDVDGNVQVINTVTPIVVNDSGSIDFTLTGTGAPGNPWTLTGVVDLSTDAGNNLSFGGDGGLYLNACAAITANCPAVTNVAYNGLTGDMTFTYHDATTQVINLPVENFLANAVYNAPTNELTLTLTDGTIFTIDLTDLVDTYTVSDTNSINLTLLANNISADLILDPNPLNLLSVSGAGVLALETVTTLTSNGNGTFTYTSEDGTTTTFREGCISADVGNTLVLGTDNCLYVPAAVAGSFTMTDGVTSQTVNSGDTLTFAAAGDLTVAVSATDTVTYSFTETVTSIGSLLVAGNIIGVYTNEAGATFTIRETVTTLVDNGNGTFTYTSENGTVTNFDAFTCADLNTCVINDLSNVEHAAPNDGDILGWDAVNARWELLDPTTVALNCAGLTP